MSTPSTWGVLRRAVPPPAEALYAPASDNKPVQFTQLLSSNRRYQLAVQDDRNMVLLRGGTAIWSSGTTAATAAAAGTFRLVLRPTGELVGLQLGSAAPFWSSRTGGLGVAPYTLAVQNNRGVVLYDGRGNPLWSTNTALPARPPFFKRGWAAIASSADGKALSAVVKGGAWWRSSDSGRSWTSDGSKRDWVAVAVSADGSTQVATVQAGNIFVTANGGANVIAAGELGRRQWTSIACSASGEELVAGVAGGSLWTANVDIFNPKAPIVYSVKERKNAGGPKNWVSVAMSSDGTAMLAAPKGDLLVSSPDGGDSWALLDCPGPRNWSAVAMAGSFQAAAEKGGQIWSNNQPGDSWASCGAWDILGRRDWAGLALATAGSARKFRLAAAAASGGVWTASFEADYANFDGEFAISTSSVVEGTARTAGRQAWRSAAVPGGSGVVAVAPGSPWGVLCSADGGKTWAPPFRGLQMATYRGLTSSSFPVPYSKLMLAEDKVVALPAVTSRSRTAAQLTGSLLVTRTGTYRLFLGSVDGSRLWLNGNLLLDNGGLHDLQFKNKTATLWAGWHGLRIESIQWSERSTVQLEWQGPGTGGRQAIGTDHLSPVEI
ncbi:hypothetical protein ABPG75_006360 [Micractinium tetrahymenae]